jgi:rod shape-determining protein MreB
MEERTPDALTIRRPLKNGVVANFEATEAMLRHYIAEIHRLHRTLIQRPRIIIGLPSSVTDVERRAVEQAARATGARKVYTIEEPIAAAIGAGLPLLSSKGSLVVDIGGGTVDIATISYGGIASTKSLRIAGDELNSVIMAQLRASHGIIIGRPTADRLKRTVASVHRSIQLPSQRAHGKDVITGLPKTVLVTTEHLREPLVQELRPLFDAIRSALDSSPVEMINAIARQGVILTGGGALLAGLNVLMKEELKVDIKIPNNPMTGVVEGAAMALRSPKTYGGLIGARL